MRQLGGHVGSPISAVSSSKGRQRLASAVPGLPGQDGRVLGGRARPCPLRGETLGGFLEKAREPGPVELARSAPPSSTPTLRAARSGGEGRGRGEGGHLTAGQQR